MQTPTTTTTTTTATTSTASTATSETTIDSESDGLLEKAADTAKDAAQKVDDLTVTPDEVVGGVVSAPFDALNDAAGELAGTAFGDLAEIGNGLGDPANVIIAGLTLTLHMIAGFVAFAAIATTLLFIVLSPRRKFGSRLTHLGTSSAKFLVISSIGVALGVAMVELSGRLTNTAIETTLPDDIATDANLFDAGLAVTVVPLVGVAFDFQQFFVGILIALWPLAAAVSILKKFENLLVTVSSMFVANIAWPPLAALAIGQAFASLPSVGTATWWCLAAVATAPIANGIALAAKN